MKIKPVYLYGSLIIIAIVVLIFSTRQNEKTVNKNIQSDEQMPSDEVHKQFQGNESSNPSKENVSTEYHERLNRLKAAVEENPNDTLKLREYADFLSAAHQSDEAVTYYNKILQIDGKRNDIRFSLAFIYYNQKKFDKAKEENMTVLKSDPNNQIALYNLGAIAATLGDKNSAKDYWNKVVKIDPESSTGKLAAQSLGEIN